MLKHLNEKNSVTIYSVTDPCFETYGRVISNINCNELISFMEQNTVIPEKGNIYVASVEELERICAFHSTGWNYFRKDSEE